MRVFCPTHEASFEVVLGPKIICQITGHTLSVGFPNSEIWEFCANCETFTPSQLGKGEKARNICFSCHNKISTRSVCRSCNTLNFECDSPAKGKRHKVTSAGMTPQCLACAVTPESKAQILHRCGDIEADVYIGIPECPFCLEPVSPSIEPKVGVPSRTSVDQSCPVCEAPVRFGASFCSQCRYRFDAVASSAGVGSDISLTPIMGNLCPNCSTPVPSDSSFCGECGQSIIASIPPPPPPPRKKKIEAPATSEITGTPKSNLQTTKTTKDPPVAAIVGSICIGLVIISAIMFASQSSIGSNNSNGTNLRNLNMGTNANVVISTPKDYFAILSEGVERRFSGTYVSSGMSLTLTLTRNGSNLEGVAETDRSWDRLAGTIDRSGKFKLEGWEKDTKYTGLYSGGFVSDTEIYGSWSLPDGNNQKQFRIYLQ